MIFLIIGTVTLIGAVLGYIGLRRYSEKIVTKYKVQQYKFTDDKLNKEGKTIMDEAEIYLSLIVPAYNEENRIQYMLESTLEYLKERLSKDASFTFEIIVVDDGSKDKTCDVVTKVIDSFDNRVRLLRLVDNRGKGFAVKQGMLRARGRYALMLDADAATKISDVEKLERDLKKIEKTSTYGGMALGSRREVHAEAERTFIRGFISYIFNLLVRYAAGIPNVKDTQCGFKLFSRSAARYLFINQHCERWCFDIDLLILAQHVRLPFIEIAVTWKEVPGSHLTVGGMLGIIRDLFLIRLYYLFGFWSIQNKPVLPQ